MKHLSIYEDFPAVYSDPVYANDIFKISIKQINDLSNKRANDTEPIPINDLLDGFREGDYVEGLDKHDKKHRGKITSIVKDEKGMGTGIKIDEDGKIVNLVITTVKMTDKVGQRDPQDPESADRNLQDFDPTAGPGYDNTSYESVSLKNLKKFSDI